MRLLYVKPLKPLSHVKLGSIPVPCGRLELFKQGKTKLGKHLDQVPHKKQHASMHKLLKYEQ